MAENIDLFGNTTLSPRQVIQQQLAKSVENTQALYKDASPVNKAAATWGAGLGGLFRQVLQEKGIIDKDPEVVKAENMQKVRQETDQEVQERGIAFGTPEYFEYVAAKANEAGMPEIGLKAIGYRDLAQAAKTKKEADQAAAVKNLEGYTPESQEEFRKTGDRSKLVMTGGSEKSPFAKINPKDYTSDSLRVYLKSGNVADLIPAKTDETRDKDADRQFNKANKLRDEFRTSSKEYIDVRDSYGRIQESAKSPSAAGDLALIFNYMKMLDPGSTVREGEFATAQNSASVPDRVRAMYNKTISGERLADNVRTDFVSRATMLFKKQEQNHSKLKSEYSRLAKLEQIKPDVVIVDFSPEKETVEEKPKKGLVKINTDEEYNKLPSGTEFIDPNGVKRKKP